MSFLPVANNIVNPAFVVDNCYQSMTNLKVSQSRVLARDSYRQSFLSLQLPSNQITFTLPSNALVGNVLVTASFNLPPNSVPAGYYLPKGWLFKAIRNIYWTYGGSETISITGHQNFIRHMCECEEDQKKTAILGYGGDLVRFDATDAPIIGTVNGIASASIPIYCPHSSVNAMKQIPFDANLLNQNITIRIDLEAAAILWATTTTAGGPGLGAMSSNMTSLNFGEFWLRQFEMVDTTASKKYLVGPGSRQMQQYFFYYPQDFKSNVLSVTQQATPPNVGISPVQNVILNGFKNGSLQSIVLALERNPLNYNVENGTIGSGRPVSSWMDTKRLTNIQLEYSGNIIYRAQYADAAQLLDLCNNTTDSTYAQDSYQITNLNGPPSAVVLNAPRAALYRIQLSQFSEVFRDYLQTGADISANVMTLRFQILDNNLAAAATGPREYFLYAQYVYQASLAVQQGVGMFQWVNPLPTPGPLMNGSVNDQIPRGASASMV